VNTREDNTADSRETEGFVVATHAGRHHADDILSCWFLWLLLGDGTRIVRTDDPELQRHADWLVDTGGVFCQNRRRFDHHHGADVPEPKNPRRPAYATAGLLWRALGYKIIAEILEHLPDRAKTAYLSLDPVRRATLYAEIFGRLDRDVVGPVDAWDNGYHPKSVSVVPVQWLLPHLDFDTALAALGEAFAFRVVSTAMQELGAVILREDLRTNGPTEFYLFGEEIVVVAGDAESRLEWGGASRMVSEDLGMELGALVVPIRKGAKWAALLGRRLEADRELPPGIESASGRKAVYAFDRRLLLDLVKNLATERVCN
jgi:hypothetical protein